MCVPAEEQSYRTNERTHVRDRNGVGAGLGGREHKPGRLQVCPQGRGAHRVPGPQLTQYVEECLGDKGARVWLGWPATYLPSDHQSPTEHVHRPLNGRQPPRQRSEETEVHPVGDTLRTLPGTLIPAPSSGPQWVECLSCVCPPLSPPNMCPSDTALLLSRAPPCCAASSHLPFSPCHTGLGRQQLWSGSWTCPPPPLCRQANVSLSFHDPSAEWGV